VTGATGGSPLAQPGQFHR